MTVKATAGDILALATAAGDMLISDGAGSFKKLAKGTANQVLKMNSSATDVEWGNAAVGIQPTKIYSAGITQTNCQTSTDYSLLNISAKGIVNRILLKYVYGGTAVSNGFLFIKVTVDGGSAYTITGPFSSDPGAFLVGGATYCYNDALFDGDNVLLWTGPLFFNTSILIQVSQSWGGNATLYGYTDYATE